MDIHIKIVPVGDKFKARVTMGSDSFVTTKRKTPMSALNAAISEIRDMLAERAED